MPYTRITPSRNGREAIDYALGGVDAKGHNGNEVRNLLVGSVNMLPPEVMGYADQMDMYWRRASSRNKTQVRRIITSYSKDELDPEDPHSAEIALAIAQEHAREAYPGRQVLICVQADGEGGCIHAHEIVNNVSMLDGKGCTNEQTKFHYVAKTVDEVAKKYITLSMDYGDKYDEKTHTAKVSADNVTQNERRMRDANREAVTAGQEPLHYIWKDDLKGRVLAAMSEATSRDDYLKRLTAHGVEGEYRTSKKQGDYIIYELADTAGFGSGKIPGNLKTKSYKLGSDYGLEALDEAIQRQVTAPAAQQIGAGPVHQEAEQEPSPEEQGAQEEARRFREWREENGYSWYDEDGKISVKRMDEAKRAYDAYKAAQAEAVQRPQEAQERRQEPQDMELPTEPEKPVYEPDMPRHGGKRAAGEGSRGPTAPGDGGVHKEQEQPEPAREPDQQPVKSALLQKLLWDMAEADRKREEKAKEQDGEWDGLPH